ncbi:hypothetical protein K503DRAFT_565649 [Rhizopogon vinicolor AM-OR11-026]|uniref:Uncharacterized protein n=1 Tax=Rhizopogon vinicolor AM-OR11-026 TaxID=1314800 RepID=A0A1B7N7W1_9AGAM|nr:hypothetical protein K503DRAFT_565649 [Rhizopogon vinicolor AM-OR11-026]
MCSPYARSVSPPPNLPAKLRRKSSSASINAPSSFNTDDEDLDSPSPSSPLPSSSPLQTPICSSPPTYIATRYSHSYITLENSPYGTHMEFDDPPSSPTPLYPRGRSSKQASHQRVTSVLNKHGRYLGSEDDVLDYQPRSKHNSDVRLSPPSPAHDLPEDNGCDLEGMNIHLRETYFATSSERGRWKSSPIIPRTSAAKPYMSGPIRPYRGQSTPVKSTPNTKSSLLEFREFVRRQSTSGVIEDPLRSPFLAASDHNDSEVYRNSSPLPPSSPPTSPMSLALSQPDDCVFINDDMNLDDDCSSDDVRVCSLISPSRPVIEHSRCSSTSSSKIRFLSIQKMFCHVMLPSPTPSARSLRNTRQTQPRTHGPLPVQTRQPVSFLSFRPLCLFPSTLLPQLLPLRSRFHDRVQTRLHTFHWGLAHTPISHLLSHLR